jgi:cytochrome c553
MKYPMQMIILALAGSLSLGAQAGGNAADGQALANERCQACHGSDGNSTNAQYPRLAGQHASYLERALLDYKSGARSNPIMAGFAAGLTEQQIKDVSAWFASQTGLETTRMPRTVSE